MVLKNPSWGTGAPACASCTRAEAGGLLLVPGQPGLNGPNFKKGRKWMERGPREEMGEGARHKIVKSIQMKSRLVVARGCQKRKQEVMCSKVLSLSLRW